MRARVTPATIATIATLTALAAVLLLPGCGSRSPEPLDTTLNPDTTRTLALGTVIGIHGRHGAHAWLGLPYAQPPVADLRWRAPQPPLPWTTPHAANRRGALCPQIASPLGGVNDVARGTLTGNEDCLYLDIHAPAMSRNTMPAPDQRLPVMVWIHGGGNTVGHAGFYDGAKLASTEQVVVVVLQYRLGPLGWFQHAALGPDGTADASAADASGNFGTLDLIAGLNWVREHISAFGGDPGQVTVFGESAGGTNVFSLLLAPAAEGLFQQAISQSGTPRLVPASVASAPLAAGGHRFSSAEVAATLLASPGRSRADLLASGSASAGTAANAAALRAVPVATLFKAYSDGLLGPRLPTVIGDGQVLPAGDPLALLADPASHHQVPVLLGSNRDEPKIFMAFDPAMVTRIAGLPVARKDPPLYEAHGRYGALAWKARGVDNPARALAAAGTPVYAYRWDWDEQGRLFGMVDLTRLLGAAHGLEIPFVFGHFDIGPQSGLVYPDHSAEGRLELSRIMMGYWASFAASGSPVGPAPWEAWTADRERFLLLDSTGDGGQRMSADTVTVPAIIAALADDPDLANQAQRCAVLASAFGRGIVAQQPGLHAAWHNLAGNGCGAYGTLLPDD